MKKTIFLTIDEEKDLKDFVKELIEKDKRETDFIESGGFRIEIENRPEKNKKGKWLFSIYRCIGYVEKEVD